MIGLRDGRQALLHCNAVCHSGGMSTNPSEAKAARELDRLTANFHEAESVVEDARKAVQEAVVRHLRQRSAPPGAISKHSPYDRNHVGVLGREAGVPPLRGPNAGPAPVYDSEAEAAALRELDALTAAFKAAEERVKASREKLQAAIAKHYAARTLKPGEIAKHSPYERNHILRIARAANVPPIRERKPAAG